MLHALITMSPATRISVLSSLAVLSAFLLAANCSAHGSNGQSQSLAYTYSGSRGPDKWGELDPAFSTCSKGKAQSPVDIVKKKAVVNKNLKALDRSYIDANATLVNTGASVGVFFKEDAGVMMANGKNYTFKQMHWHTPSEHRINGQQFAAELHLLHQADDGGLAVVAMLYEHGDSNPLIQSLKKKMGELNQEKCESHEEAHIALGEMETKNLMKKARKYYTYKGSLTTPPCSELVTWFIHGKVRTISKEEVELLEAPLNAAYKNNSRPVQPLNDRKIEVSDHN